MGLCCSTCESRDRVTFQFDSYWLPFLHGKTISDYRRATQAQKPFPSHEQGEAWAKKMLNRMHTGLERLSLAGVYKFDIRGLGNEGRIEICCNVTNPEISSQKQSTNRNFRLLLHYTTTEDKEESIPLKTINP